MSKTRVCFLCLGNSCRSQMAEGFARTYGSDVLIPMSAGLTPAMSVAPLTRSVMLERNIDLGDAFPKSPDLVMRTGVDLLINMSGSNLPQKAGPPVEKWDVRDPIGESDEVYRQVRDEIEQRVMRLILRLRSQETATTPPPEVDTRRRRFRQ